MNYRHAFHAGNFADVAKHAVLSRILVYLARKPAPFRVIDTHAGAGLYDLAGDAATRTGEWRDGVARLARIDSGSPAGVLLAPYRAIIAAAGDARYPGSPLIAQALMRPTDRAVFCETQADVRALLLDALGHDKRIKCPAIDGWLALNAFVPPPERRGLVLIDPPFEAVDEFERLADGFNAAFAKWPTGVFVLWYPVKALARRDAFLTRLALTEATALRIEFGVGRATPDGPLAHAGLVVVNPPFVLADEMSTILPALAGAMHQDAKLAHWSVAPLEA